MRESDKGVFTGKRMEYLREAHGYKQEQVAKDLGIEQSTLSRWEQAQEKLTVEKLRKVATYYDVSLEWLLSPEPIVLNVHDSKVENGANGTYSNTVNVVPEEFLKELASRYDRHIEALQKLTERVLALVETDRRTG